MAKGIREKTAKRNAERDKRPQATAKYIRISPTKVRIVLDIIRGQDYNTALAVLKNTPKSASEVIVKVLESAGANAENNLNMSKNDLYIAECFANAGVTLKRYWYRSHGSADTLKKRTSHITIILDEKKNKELITASKKEIKAETVTKESVKEVKEPVKKETVKKETVKEEVTKTVKKVATKKPATVKAKEQTQQGGEE